MTEPDVVITDYLLTIESAAFAALLLRHSAAERDLQRPFALFFGAVGVSAFAGGTVHGFFLSNPPAIGVWLWRAALLSIGVAAACAWTVGARLLFAPTTARRLRLVAWVEWIVYAVIVATVSDKFWIAIANYLPATLFLIFAFASSYRDDAQPPVGVGLVGLTLTLVAAAIQQLRVGLHPVYFNHNAFYHVVQAVALFLIFWSAQFFVAGQKEAAS